MDKKAERFEALDSWRGLAAIAVALFHFKATGFLHSVSLIRNADLAVPFFFVLSGFVVTHAYYDKVTDAVGAGRFLLRRFGRLYPLHIFVISIFVALECLKAIAVQHGYQSYEPAFSGTNDIASLVANILLLQAVVPFVYPTWNAPSWSISVEFYTYVLFAVVFMLGKYRLQATGAVLLVSGAALLLLDSFHSGVTLTSGLGLAQSLVGFSAGVLTYQLFRWLKAKDVRIPTIVEIAAAALMAVTFHIHPRQTVISIVAFSVVVIIFAFQAGHVSTWLKTRPLLFLGRLSYSIYLLHFLFFAVLFLAIRVLQAKLGIALTIEGEIEPLIHFGFPGATDLLALAYLATVVAAASITYEWIEKPGRAFFNRLSNRVQPPALAIERSVEFHD
jgi:peptidoglycan/LPS O-acetylase OafA/YrhL